MKEAGWLLQWSRCIFSAEGSKDEFSCESTEDPGRELSTGKEHSQSRWQGIIQVDQVVRTTSRTLNLEKMFEAVAIQEKVVPCPALHFSQPVKSVQPIRVLSCLDNARKKTKKTI